MYIVTEKDLIGDIEGFPIEVVQKMVERQYEQRLVCIISIFQNNKTHGFNWCISSEGFRFWHEVILNRNFKLFFERYPKQEEDDSGWFKPEGVRMLVWDDKEKWAKERIVIAKLPKNAVTPYVCVNYDCEEYFEKGEKYSTSRYKNAKPLPKQTELTLQQIAEKFGLNVDEIKIV